MNGCGDHTSDAPCKNDNGDKDYDVNYNKTKED